MILGYSVTFEGNTGQPSCVCAHAWCICLRLIIKCITGLTLFWLTKISRKNSMIFWESAFIFEDLSGCFRASHCLNINSIAMKQSFCTVFSLGLFGVVHTTWFVWYTTWLVPGNPFAPFGLNSNYDIHSATRLIKELTQAIQCIYKGHLGNLQFAPLGLQFLARTLLLQP